MAEPKRPAIRKLAVDPETNAAERRAEYRDQLADLAEDHPDLTSSDLARLLLEQFDQRQRDEAAFDYLNSIAVFAQQYRQMISAQRAGLRKILTAPASNGEVGRGRPSVSLYDRVQEWKEKVPNGSYRPVLKMNRLELQGVIQARMKSVVGEVFWIELLRRIVAAMPNDVALVEAHLSDTDIAKLAATVQKGMQHGNLRFRFEPTVQALPSPFGLSRQTRRRNT